MTSELGPPAGALAPRAAGPLTVAVYLQGHPAMRSSLTAVLKVLGRPDLSLESFPFDSLRYEHMETIRAKLAAAYAPATARRHLAAVRGVLETAWKMQRISREDFERAISIDTVTGDSEQAGRMLTTAEVARLFEVAGWGADRKHRPAETLRDRALLALAVYGGLRRDELSKLDIGDVDVKTGKVDVLGKGRKHREVWIPEPARAHVRAWFIAREPVFVPGRGAEYPRALFYRMNRSGRPLAQRLSATGVWEVLTRLGATAGLRPPITPHDFRRTYASMLLDVGVDLPTVQTLMGHASPNTTSKYDRRGDERKKDAAEKLAKAFKGKEP